MKSFRIQGQKGSYDDAKAASGLNIERNLEDHDMRVRKDARMDRGP